MNGAKRILFALVVVGTCLSVVLLGILAALGDAALHSTARRRGCQPPAGWVAGPVVQSGQTLAELALEHGTSVGDLREGNCLPEEPEFLTGRRLHVPPAP